MNNEYKGYVEMTDEEIGILIDAVDVQIDRLNNFKKHFEASFSETDNTIIDIRIERMNNFKKKFEACLSTASDDTSRKKYSEYEKELKEIFNKETFEIDYDLSDLTFFSTDNLDKVINYLTDPSSTERNILTVKTRIEKFQDVYLMKYGSIVYGLINDLIYKEMA